MFSIFAINISHKPCLCGDFGERPEGRTKMTLSSDEVDSGENIWPRIDDCASFIWNRENIY